MTNQDDQDNTIGAREDTTSLQYQSGMKSLSNNDNDKGNDNDNNSPPPFDASSSLWLRKYAAEAGPGILNVHVVPHTHDDVGWRKTVEQYYFGFNETIDLRGRVHAILSTSVQALLLHSYRTFTYVESKFWYMWWTQTATAAQRNALQYLVTRRPSHHQQHQQQPRTNRPSEQQEQEQQQDQQQRQPQRQYNQWTFVNGGWSMHDEACAHFMGMVDSTTLGHDLLRQELDVIPTIGWQLDPFGHSATQARWFTHALGFDALYFGRIDYQDLELRRQHQQTEGLWNPSLSTSDDTNNNDDDDSAVDPTIFWGLTGSYGGNYGPPGSSFCFDEPLCGDRLLPLNETTLQQQLQLFLELLVVQAQQTPTTAAATTDHNSSDILLTMGTDFTYSHAEVFFANLDYLIGQVMWGQANNQWNISAIFHNVSLTTPIQRVNIFYSSPEYYTERKHQQLLQQQQQQQQQQGQKQGKPQPPERPEVLMASSTSPRQAMGNEPARVVNKTGWFYDSDDSATTTTARTDSFGTSPTTETTATTTTNTQSSWSGIKTDDFFPYSDCPHCFWTGYFTSRTAFKRFERVASGFLQAARQLEFLSVMTTTVPTTAKEETGQQEQESNPNDSPPFFALEDALGVSQHHDAITGTGMQHVANDYSRRLQAGLDQAAAHVESWVQAQLHLSNMTWPLRYCGQLNESICEPATDADFAAEQVLLVVIYNPLAQTRGWRVQLPVSVNGTFVVERVVDDNEENEKNSNNAEDRLPPSRHQQIVRARPVPSSATFGCTRKNTAIKGDHSLYQIAFYASNLIPLGAVTYRISLQEQLKEEEENLGEEDHWTHKESDLVDENDRRPETNHKLSRSRDHLEELVTFQDSAVQAWNGHGLMAWFDRRTGQLQRVSTDHGATTMSLEIQWGYYLPYDHDIDQSDDGRENSGAYIFRPSTPNASLTLVHPISFHFVVTEQGLEVHTTYTDDNNLSNAGWIQQIVRVSQDQPWIEVQYTVGPIPLGGVDVDDDDVENDRLRLRGKEVVSRFVSSDIQSNGVFYTDSNGRMFLKRQRNYRPTWNLEVFEPVAGNYYPVTTAIYIQDQPESSDDDSRSSNTSTRSLGLVTDRARGGGSIVDGSLEVMVHRRTLVDDHRGVEEPMNETCGGQIEPYPPYGSATRIGEGAIVSGIHRIVLGCNKNNDDGEEKTSGAKGPRSIMDQVFAQPLIFVAPATIDRNDQEPQKSTFSVLGGAELPPNVFFMTLAVRHMYPASNNRTHDDKNRRPVRKNPGNNTRTMNTNANTTLLLIRLAHQYGPDEDSVLSTPVQVNFAVLFQPKYKVISIVETTLSGNQNWADFVSHHKYNWTTTTTTKTPTESVPSSSWFSDEYDESTTTLKFSDEYDESTTSQRIRRINVKKDLDVNNRDKDYTRRSIRRSNNSMDTTRQVGKEDNFDTVITLRPLHIRTFEVMVELDSRHSSP
ncbi:hypothetical protein ACA910_014693 [Epithemia clementina (nom. ined.)]